MFFRQYPEVSCNIRPRRPNNPCHDVCRQLRQNLYNERPAWLDLAHKKLDAAVAAAYGWPPDLTDDQVLERLLALNLERAAEEENQSKAPKPKTQRPKHLDELV